MRYEPLLHQRVLAVDPHRGGFGFAVLEDEPFQLVDWGTCSCHRTEHGSCLLSIERLIAQYQPTLFVLEDWKSSLEYRRVALEDFVERISGIFSNGIAVRCYSRAAVREAFASTGALSKYQIAQVIAARFPELEPRLPRPRKAWEGEDRRMSIFDAASFAITHLGAAL
jgi:Holliday junction resolvasome RuvABC endonuclease subunit